MQTTPAPKPWYRILYVWVIIGVLLGIVVGYYWAAIGTALFPPPKVNLWPDVKTVFEPLGKGFINLVKMLIAPIIFCTVVHGIASMGDLKKLGRVGGKTLLYFEVVSTLALVIGLVVVNILKPGEGFNIDPKTLDPGGVLTL